MNDILLKVFSEVLVVKNKIIYTVSIFLLLAIGLCVLGTPIDSNAAVLKIGDTLTVGSWEQNNNTADGSEALSWSVVDMREGKAVLLLQNIIDCQMFGKTDASWQASSLRTWLNETFYTSAFRDTEKAFIIKKTNQSKTADLSSIETTEDYAYILSVDEARNLSRKIDGVMKSKATASAVKKGLFTDSDGYGYWWLRTPGSDSQHAAYVTTDGNLYVAGCKTSYANFGGVRPAIQIDLNKSGFGGNTLTVNYVYKDGKKAAQSYFAGISSGENYDVKSPEISGYAADKTNVAGTMGTSDVVITVTYKSTAKIDRTINKPVKVSAENGTVILNKIVPNGDGTVSYGYSLKNDINSVAVWSESTEFKGLVGGTTYYFFAKVTGSAEYKDAYSAGTSVFVDKTDRTISAPEILNYNHNAVAALDVHPEGGGVVLYGISSTNNYSSIKEWQEHPVFNGLSSGVKYYLFAKVAETDNFKAAYSYSDFTTTSSKTATEIPTVKSVSENMIELNPVEVLIGIPKYGISSTADVSGVNEWTENTHFGGLETGKRYFIFVKIENNSAYTSEVYSFTTAVTVSGVRDVMPAEIVSIDSDCIQVKTIAVSGSDFVYFGISRENNADNVSVWQTANTFTNLTPNTEYYIFTKLSNGNTAEDIISDSVYAKTKETVATETPAVDTPAVDTPATDTPATDIPATNIPATDVPGITDVPVEESQNPTQTSGFSVENNGNTREKEESSAWWIVVVVIAVIVIVCGVVFILIKKKDLFKGIKLSKDVPGEKSDDSDDFENSDDLDDSNDDYEM